MRKYLHSLSILLHNRIESQTQPDILKITLTSIRREREENSIFSKANPESNEREGSERISMSVVTLYSIFSICKKAREGIHFLSQSTSHLIPFMVKKHKKNHNYTL